MTVYLGQIGRLVELYSTPAAQVVAEERYTFKTTLEGSRKAQVRKVGRRTWSLNASFADPAEVATLMQFASGAWGNGPFWFVSADAPFMNLLPPTATTSVFGSHVDGGPMLLEGGAWAPFSTRLSAGGSGTLSFVASTLDPPVLPNMPVTASAWVLGTGASVMLQFFSAAGSLLSSVSSGTVTATAEARRVSVTADAPNNAATARVTARNALAAAQPAISWTDKVQGFADGQGCPRAVLHGASRDLVMAAPGRTYSNVGYTVTEVG